MSYFFKQKWWAIAILLLLVINIITLCVVWNRSNRDFSAPDRPTAIPLAPPDYLPSQLRFSDQQRQAYTRLFIEHENQVRSLKDSIRLSKEALFDLLKKDSTLPAQTDIAAEKAAAYQEKLDILTFEHFKKLKQICTEEQRKQFDKVIQDVIRHMAPPPPPPPLRKGNYPMPPDENAPSPPPPAN